MVSGCLVKIVSSDTRHNFLLHYLAALGVVLLTPVIFGVSRLDELLAAQPLEFFLPLMGAILMPAVFMPEQNESIRDVVRSKKTPYLGVCFMRLLCGVVFITALTGAFVLYMKSMDSVVTMRLFAGSLASTFALGAAGFLASAVSDNVIVGYMTAVIYYICNFGLKDKLGVFFLFSMTTGSFEEKKWLCILSVVLVVSGFVLRRLFRER
ncbi:MAG: hypothetical protein IJK30_12435 [Ruminococcus sp.]|nr:hypothetical protein [Ruminococcus sp.]